MTGTGTDAVEVDHHPDTGATLVGVAIPGWPDLTKLTCEAAQVFPKIGTQSWDVALTKEPIFLELNFGGDLNLHQIARRAGVLDDRYRKHLRNCGYAGRL